MPVPNYEKRRPPQNPMDGKGENRYSRKVQSATDAVKSNDIEDFSRDGESQQVQSAMNPVAVIANFSRLGEALKRTGTFMEVAKQIAGIAEMAEATVMQEAGDWFDGHTIKRNMNELKKHAGAFVKLAQEMDMMQQRSTALYDDMGSVLSRYFELAPLQDASGAPFGGKKAPEFDGAGGNPADDEGRKKHDAQDGMLGDASPGYYAYDDEDGEDDETVETIVDAVMNRIVPTRHGVNEAQSPGTVTRDGNKWSAVNPKGTESVRLKSRQQAQEFAKTGMVGGDPNWDEQGEYTMPIDEKGEETEFRARKALRTPKSFARQQQGFTHDKALEILRRLGVKDVDEARQVFSKISEMMQVRAEGGPGSGPGKGSEPAWWNKPDSQLSSTQRIARDDAKEMGGVEPARKAQDAYDKKHGITQSGTDWAKHIKPGKYRGAAKRLAKSRTEGGPGSGPRSSGKRAGSMLQKLSGDDTTQLTPAAARAREEMRRDLKKLSKNEGYPKKHKGRRKLGSKKRQAAKNRKKIRQKHK